MGKNCELIILKEKSEQKTKIISQIFGISTAFSNHNRNLQVIPVRYFLTLVIFSRVSKI